MSDSESQQAPELSASTPASKKSVFRRILGALWLIPVAASLAVMVYVTKEVLIPSAGNPQSNLYNSSWGYPAQQRRAGKPIEVATTRVSNELFTDFVAAAGETVAQVDIDLRTQISGVVDEVLIEEGQRVKRGDVLVRLDAGPSQDHLMREKARLAIAELDAEYSPQVDAATQKELEATVAKAKEHVDIVESRLARYKTLQNASAASAEEIALINETRATRVWELASAEQQLASHLLSSEERLKRVEHTLATRKASVQEAERNLKDTVMVAPCDGMITRVGAQPGEVLVAETAAAKLTGDVVFKAFVDQTQVNSVKPGDHAMVRLLAHPGKQFHGSVIRVNPTIDTRGVVVERGRVDTRFTYSAWVQLDGEDAPPGLQGHVEFRKEAAHPSIPESAIIHFSGGEGMVMVIRDGRAAMARVELGPVRGPAREVKSGLAEGDEVVLHPLGLRVNDLLKPIDVKHMASNQ